MMHDPARYPMEVHWSDEDEGYVALAPDLPGCSAWGETRADALAELAVVVADAIKGHIAVGNPVPAPSRQRRG